MDYTQDRLRKSIDTACEMGYRGLRFATSRDENVDRAIMQVLRSWGCHANYEDDCNFIIDVDW